MNTKPADPLSPGGFPPPAVAREASRDRYAIVDRASGEVIVPTPASLADILAGVLVRPPSGDEVDVAHDAKGRRSARPGRRRAYRQAIRSSGHGSMAELTGGASPSGEGGHPSPPPAAVPAGLPSLGDRMAVSDFQAEADRLSLPLGTAPSDAEALERLKVVAADATDIFPDPEAAIAFLTTRPLDGRGRNGIAILREKGLPGIISSLDQRRFGYSG